MSETFGYILLLKFTAEQIHGMGKSCATKKMIPILTAAENK
jgi:hypothetical protein